MRNLVLGLFVRLWEQPPLPPARQLAPDFQLPQYLMEPHKYATATPAAGWPCLRASPVTRLNPAGEPTLLDPTNPKAFVR